MASASCAILLTPPGVAAIAVVRLTGQRVAEFLRAHFSKTPAEGRAVHGTLTDGQRVLDNPVVVLGADGAFVDVNLHGGAWIVQSVLELARREGFEVTAHPSVPLPEEAVDGQTPLEREVLSHLPLARTEMAVRVLLAQPTAWEQMKRSRSISLQSILDDPALQWLLHPPRVAIIGAPNVGKSTLANQLFAQERSITADLPGTTRDWVGELANIDGLAVLLVDTPGLRQTADPVEQLAIQRSGNEIRRADLVLLVLDASMAFAVQQPLLEAYPRALPVANKSDLPAAWDTSAVEALPIVATTGQGVESLRHAILARFGCADPASHAARVWTDRQREILRRALSDPAAIQDI